MFLFHNTVCWMENNGIKSHMSQSCTYACTPRLLIPLYSLYAVFSHWFCTHIKFSNLVSVIDVLPCSSHSSSNSPFFPLTSFLLTRCPQIARRRCLCIQTVPETHSSSFEGVDPLADTHPPRGTWDESAEERYITTQSASTRNFEVCARSCVSVTKRGQSLWLVVAVRHNRLAQ